MALVKKTQLDKTEIVGEFKHVQCRHATWVEEDSVMVGSKTYHRHVIAPGDDVSNEPAETQAIVAAVHTPAVVTAYNEMVAAQLLEAQ
tara:strand:- start:47 stop:310 length:264 start_codon:yes stop_codon:yes gene_type:complete